VSSPAGLLSTLPLSEKQVDYVVNSDAFVNLADGAIRAGKTISGLLKWLIFVANAPRGGDLVVTAKTFDTATRNVFGPLQNPDLFGPLAKATSYRRGAPTAKILGRTIEVITFNNEAGEQRLRGMTCAGGYVDEWSLMPEVFHEQLIGRCSLDGAQLFGNTNPDGPMHWLKKNYIDESGPGQRHYGDWKIWKFGLDDNPALSEKVKARYRRQYVGLWYKRMILGEWCLAEGAIYEAWNPDKHIVKTLPTITRWISLGVDYGTVNPFSGLVLGVGSDGNLYLCREWRWDSKKRMRQLTDVEYSARVRAWLLEHRIEPEWWCVDPSAASFITQLWQDQVSPVYADNSVLDGVRVIASLMAQDALYVHESCEGWLAEVAAYTWDPDKAEKGEDAPLKVNDHSMDAGRYAIRTTQHNWHPLLRKDLVLAA
jgi:PBSX family phage terminase large subunit